MKLANIVGVLLLIFGVAAGVVLVQNVQEFREKAKQPDKHTVCHKTGSADNPYVTIEVDDHALKAHIDHGDTIGSCPDGEDGGNNNGNNGSNNGNGGNNGSGTNTSVNTNSLDNEQTSEGNTQTQIITDTQYVYLNPGTLDFYIKFQGINEKRTDKSVRVEMRKGDNEVHIYEDVPVKSDNTGVYHGQLKDLPVGTYNIFIKDINHLQTMFEDVPIVRGNNRWFWIENQILVGDLDSDNDLDIDDLALFLAKYREGGVDTNIEDINYDINLDGVIDDIDLELMLENYKELTIFGDE